MDRPESLNLDTWCTLDFAVRRQALGEALAAALWGADGLESVAIEPGPPGCEYDLTAVAVTDVGPLRTPLWSHTRASLFCDPSVHPASREPFSPAQAVEEAAERLRRRLAVPFTLEARGLTLRLSPEPGVERTWTAEHSRFRKRTAVVREDRVETPDDLDVRDLLAAFYTGPSLRLVGPAGETFLLRGSSDTEGFPATLCRQCGGWAEGLHRDCLRCGSGQVERVTAVRQERRR
jgi:hypothetical protein